VGTYGGATRFDGVAFRTYARREGLGSNTVVAITEDRLGRLVLGVRDGVCVRLADRFRCLDPEDARRAGQTNGVLADTSGGLWLAAAGGLAHLDSAGHARWPEVPGGGGATAIARDSNHVIWVATERGLFRQDPDEFIAVPRGALDDGVIRRLRASKEGLLVITDRRIFRLRDGALRPVPGLPASFDTRVTDAIETSDGALLITTLQGALRYTGGRVARLMTGPGGVGEEVNTVDEDRDGTIWLGTESGLVRVTPSAFDNYQVAQGLPNEFVRALAEDAAGRLWVGTRAGLAVREGDRFRAVPLRGIDPPRVYAIAVLPAGGLLVGSRDGLLHYEGGLRRVYLERDGLPDRFVVSLLTDPTGGAWVGTQGGIVRWEAGRIVPVTDSLMRTAIAESMVRDDRGQLWVGLGDGGVLVHGGKRTRQLGAADGLSDESVWALSPDGRGGMWVGTNGDGAFRVDSLGAIERFSVAEGLTNAFVWQILVDRTGATWFYTNRGITRLDALGGVRQFGLVDGLLDLEGSANAALAMRDGSLWFGSGFGLSRVREGQARPGMGTTPVVRFEEATAGSRTLPLGKLEVGRGDGAISIRYTAPALLDAANVRFRYRLAGESDWSDPVTERVLTIAGLAPGRHTLEVTALDARGQESARPAQLTMTVLPAFWQAWWFRGLLLLAAVAAAAVVPWLRARRHEAEREHLEAMIKARTEALRESEERLRVVVEHSTNCFYSYSVERELLYASPQSEQILGYTPEEMKAHWRQTFTDHPANDEATRSTDRAIMTGQQQPPYEMELRHKSGATVWVIVNEAPVVEDGRTIAMVGSLTDITDEKAAQEREGRLADQLRQSQKLESIGRLTGGIAHDFNNLLTAVVGHAELLAQALPADSPERADAAEILRASGRAGALVAQLMAFSRQQIIKRATLDLNVVIQESARLLERIIGSDIALVVTPSPAPAWILADQGQVDQVLLNLVSNSRDAMPTGGRLEIATSHEEVGEELAADVSAGRYVVLRVTDTGGGMGEETRARVFEPFFTTKGPGEGTGLGLATVYGIVKRNGWHIDITSAPGAGATFRVYVPAAAAPARHRPASVAETPPLPAGNQQVVLVAEDEDSVRSLVCRSLRQYGYHVLEAANGDDAVAVAEAYRGRIDLLLTDVVMPGMSGKDLADAIGGARPDTPVLFMTGHSRGMLGTRGILPDATNVLSKPFRPQELVRRVQDVLG
jgi:PAS domain S-box-containing protein